MAGLRGLSWCGVVWFCLVGTVLAAEFPYPEGDSTQSYKDMEFDLRIPEGFDPAEEYSLIVIVPGEISQLDAVAEDGYVVVRPRSKFAGNANAVWSAGEIKQVHQVIEHLIKVCNIGKRRVHAVAVGASTHDIFPMLVYGKRAKFVSATYCESEYYAGSFAPRARKELGVLAYDHRSDYGPIAQIVDKIEKKVRHVELRRNDTEGLSGPYFRFFLKVMEGRFEPGVDLSFGWDDDAETLPSLKAMLAGRKHGGFLYFFSKTDTENEHTRHLQNTVFFDRDVREHGRRVLAVKVEREKHEKLFASFGLKSTPAVVVLDHAHEVKKTFEGKIKAKSLAKVLKKVTPE